MKNASKISEIANCVPSMKSETVFDDGGDCGPPELGNILFLANCSRLFQTTSNRKNDLYPVAKMIFCNGIQYILNRKRYGIQLCLCFNYAK